MQGRCKLNAIEFARIAESQPVLADSVAKVSINFESANVFGVFFLSERGFIENLTAAARDLQRPVNNLFACFLPNEAVLKCDSQQLHVSIELLVVEHVAHLLCILSDGLLNQSVALEPSC